MSNEHSQSRYAPEPDESTLALHKVSRPEIVVALLKEIAVRRCLVSVNGESNPGKLAISRLLDVEQNGLCLTFDSNDETRFIQAGAKLSFVSFLDSTKIQFDSQVHSIDHEAHNHGGRCIVRSTLPPDVYRIQRRKAHRILPPMDTTAKISLRNETRKETGEIGEFITDILDLSVAGVSFRIMPNLAENLTIGSQLEHCQLELDAHGSVPVTLLIRSRTRMYNLDQISYDIRVGAEFTSLPGSLAQRIHTYIVDVENARRRSGHPD